MLKEATEFVKAVLEFFRSLKVVFTVFLCSAIWLLPPARNLLPVPKPYIDGVNFAASIALLLSFTYLMASAAGDSGNGGTPKRASCAKRSR